MNNADRHRILDPKAEGDRAGQRRRSLVARTVVRYATAGVMLVIEDADRVGRGLGTALHAQLGEQGRHVVLHRLLGQEQPGGDLAVGLPVGDE